MAEESEAAVEQGVVDKTRPSRVKSDAKVSCDVKKSNCFVLCKSTP